jgi:hypothetical protein
LVKLEVELCREPHCAQLSLSPSSAALLLLLDDEKVDIFQPASVVNHGCGLGTEAANPTSR